MCSVGDDNLEDLENLKYMPAKEELSLSNSKCNKCRERTPIVVLRSKDKYCKECFLAATVHKFKALLGKHKLIRPNDRVLVVHKCGHPSTAILHFIRTGLDLETHKKLRFEPIILFTEEHSNLSLHERQELLKRVEQEVVSFSFPVFFTSLTQLIKTGVTDSVLKKECKDVELVEDDRSVVDSFLNKQHNATCKNDFLNIKRQKLLVNVAKYLKCKFIFSPELSNDVASQLLTDISLGRGSHVSLNTGFCDARDEEIKILRPLRLFDTKELAFYNHLNNLEPVTFKSSTDNSNKSIQQLMMKFVNDLQANYPATVTTILKTGDKLTLTNKVRSKCNLCNAPIEEEKSELSSAESTQFSHWVSTQVIDASVAPQQRYNNTLEAFDNLVCDNYCFGCKKLLKI